MNYSICKNYALVFYGCINEFREEKHLSLLSASEVIHSIKYLRDEDKQRFIVTRILLKKLLSIYLKIDITDIQLSYGKNGKPFMSEYPDLDFNVSHTKDVFVIGLATGKKIGVDIECLDKTFNSKSLETYLFTPLERNQFNLIDNNLKKDFFIKYWTQKEAVLKALGSGLTKPMHELEIANLDKDWFIESKNIMDNYRVAIAVNGEIKGLHYISINESEFFNKQKYAISNKGN